MDRPLFQRNALEAQTMPQITRNLPVPKRIDLWSEKKSEFPALFPIRYPQLFPSPPPFIKNIS